MNISADLGGVGGSFLDEMIVTEELGYRCLHTLSLTCHLISSFCYSPGYNIHSNIVMPYIEHYGSKEQQVKLCYEKYDLKDFLGSLPPPDGCWRVRGKPGNH